MSVRTCEKRRDKARNLGQWENLADFLKEHYTIQTLWSMRLNLKKPYEAFISPITIENSNNNIVANARQLPQDEEEGIQISILVESTLKTAWRKRRHTLWWYIEVRVGNVNKWEVSFRLHWLKVSSAFVKNFVLASSVWHWRVCSAKSLGLVYSAHNVTNASTV